MDADASDSTTEEAAGPQQTLDATVAAVQANGGDLTAIPAGTAVQTIDAWIDQLDDVSAADQVTANLRVLREELTAGDINAAKTGLVLLKLADGAQQATGGGGAAGALVSSLRAAGEKLSAEATSGESLLSQTLNAVKQQSVDITALPAAAAVGNIDSWIETLGAMSGTEPIVADLEALKAAISKPTIDGQEVAGYLSSLADSTEEVGGDNAALRALAYALRTGADKLN